MMVQMARDYNLAGFWVVDLWPFKTPLYIVADPALAVHVTRKPIRWTKAH
jgi:hypothetical protein